MARLPFSGAAMVFAVMAAVSVPAVILAPEKLVDSYGRYAGSQPPLSREIYTKLVDDCRKTIAQIFAGVVGMFAVYLIFRRTKATEQMLEMTRETLATTREGQITDRFAKAIEHLGAPDKDGRKAIEIRFGGIYALERIARDSPRDHWTVMEILCAYIRQNAPVVTKTYETAEQWYQDHLVADDPEPYPQNDPDKDIQAAIAVIGRRIATQDGPDAVLDLSRSDLSRGMISDANLSGAIISGAKLMLAALGRTNLSDASLARTNLTAANLIRANLSRANLREANLT